MKAIFKVCIIVLLFSTQAFAQNEDNKWVVGLGSNAVDFFPSNGLASTTGNNNGFGNELFNVNDHWNQFGLPKIHVTRHLWKNFSIDLAYNRNKISKIGDFTVDDLPYSSIDASIQYSILKDNSKYYPYISIGAGHTSIEDKGSGTVNGGIGFTYWFADQFGVNGDAKYKYTELDYPMIQHFQYSLSLVYRFGNRGGNGKGIECFD